MDWIKIGDTLTDVSKYSQFRKNESNFTLGDGVKYYWIESESGFQIGGFMGKEDAKANRDLAFKHLQEHLDYTEL